MRTFHTIKLTFLNWKMPTLNAFIESLTNEHDKLVQMGIIISSKYQAFFAGGPKDTNGKGKKKKTKIEPPKEKEQLDESSGSRRKNKKGKKKPFVLTVKGDFIQKAPV